MVGASGPAGARGVDTIVGAEGVSGDVEQPDGVGDRGDSDVKQPDGIGGGGDGKVEQWRRAATATRRSRGRRGEDGLGRNC